MKFPAIPLFVGFLSCVVCLRAEKIRTTAILFRHGERTPLFTIGPLTNPQCDLIGYGQLTRNGSRQSYENGSFLRRRYVHLFPADGFFLADNMKILSSPPERCTMTLQSFMAGFMPPPLNDMTLPVVWQPFAIFLDHAGTIISASIDNELCPRYNQEVGELMVNPPDDIQEWMAADKDAFEKISAELGIPINRFDTLIGIADNIRSNIAMGSPTPQWAIDAYYMTIEKYLARFMDILHETEFMLRVRGGPLITDIVNNMEAVANGTGGSEFQIYSSHDLTIISLAYTLGVRSQIPALPSYDDTIVVELLEGHDGSGDISFKVQALYVDNGQATPKKILLHIPDCGYSCSLSTFNRIVQKYLVTDLSPECVK